MECGVGILFICIAIGVVSQIFVVTFLLNNPSLVLLE